MQDDEGGFTLIEVLVAMAIFAAVISALYQGLQSGWRGMKAAELQDAAIAVAASQIESLGVETPLVPGVQSGNAVGGIAWQSAIGPYKGDSAQGASPSLDGFWVDVTVGWKDAYAQSQKSLTFTTLKLARRP